MKEEFQLVPYDLEVATIEGLKAKYMDIILPPEDKAAYAMVMGGLRECREIRLSVDAWHKDRKTWIVKAGKHYDREKNRVHGLVEPIEDHLKAVRKVEDDRVEAIQAEKIRLEQERVEGIRAKIQAIREKGEPHFLFGKTHTEIQGIVGALMEIPPTSEVFAEFTEDARKALTETMTALEDAYEARVKFEEEEAGRKAESERLEKVRKEQVAEAKRLEGIRKAEEEKSRLEREYLETERKKVAADKAALEAEKAAEAQRKRQEEFEKQALENARIAAEKAAIEKVAREAREAKEKAEAEAAEKARKEALKPDKDKILSWARELNQRLLDMRPDLESRDAQIIMDNADIAIDWAVVFAVQQAKEL